MAWEVCPANSKGRAELPAVPLLPNAGKSDDSGTLEDGKLCIGDRWESAVQSGVYFSTCSPLHLPGAWGRIRKSQGVQVSWTLPGSGRQQCSGCASTETQSKGNMGMHQPGIVRGKCSTPCRCHVLQDSGEVCASLGEQGVEPD